MARMIFITAETTHEHSSWTHHDVVIFSVLTLERSEIVAGQIDVLEDGLHLSEVRAQFFWYANVALNNTEQGTGKNVGQNLL